MQLRGRPPSESTSRCWCPVSSAQHAVVRITSSSAASGHCSCTYLHCCMSPPLPPPLLLVLLHVRPPMLLLPSLALLVAVGDALVGQVVDFLGRPYPMQQQQQAASSSSVQPHPEAEGADAAAVAPIGTDAQLPLLNGQPDMDSREQINEALMTGVRVSVCGGFCLAVCCRRGVRRPWPGVRVRHSFCSC